MRAIQLAEFSVIQFRVAFVIIRRIILIADLR